VLVIGIAASTSLVGVSTVSAQADSPTATIIDVPSGNRDNPRIAQVYGETNYGVIIREEVDPADYNGWAERAVLLAPDGSQSTIVGPTGGDAVGSVFGDLLVNARESDFALKSVTTKLLPDGGWNTTTIPSGVGYIGIAATGILLNTPNGIAIEPWGGGTLVSISGLPGGSSAGSVLAADGHGLVLYPAVQGAPSGTYAAYYIDTDTDQAWQLATTDSSEFALSATDIFWQSGEATISSVSRPSGDTGPGAVETRSIPDEYAGWNGDLYAAADNVIVAVDAHNGGYRAESIHADGSTTSLGGDFAGFAADGSALLATEGLTPDNKTIRRIDPSDGSSTALLTIAPVPAQTESVAVDGDTLVTEGNAGIVQRQLDFGTGTATSGAQLSANGSGIFAQNGAVYWTDSKGYRQRSDASGTARADTGVFDSLPLSNVGAHWAMASNTSGHQWAINVTSGAMQQAGFQSALFDDVLYSPAADFTNLLGTGVVRQDLDTGDKNYLSVPGCDRAAGVQAAASWLLVSCDNGDYVIDQSGATPEWKVINNPGGLALGNGFLVSVTRAGSISWTPLSAPHTDWQSIGATSQYEISEGYDYLAASTGDVPTIAWVDGTSQAHAALLAGVPSTGLAAHPAGGPAAAPTTPTLTSTSGDTTLTLHWSTPNPADQVVDYVIGRPGKQPVTVPGTASSYSMTGLANGYEYDYSVAAQNVMGISAAATITAAAWDPNPSAPTGITAVFDQDASSLNVGWSWASQIGSSQLTGFTVTVPGSAPIAVSLGARSTTISNVRVANGTDITVTALSASGSAGATGTSTVKAGPDPTSLVGIPSVLLGTTLHATASGVDGRALGTVDVRYRTAHAHTALGGWQYPASWKGIPSGTTLNKSGLTRGATYCLSMRARDAAGNQSDWSAQSCTVVAADDRAFSASSTWHRHTGSSYLLDTATVSTATSGHLATTMRASKLWIIARTCVGCGDIGVKVNGHTIWVSLAADATHEQVVLLVPTTGKLTGTVELIQRSKNKSVVVDGYAALDY
jgi:hypothetical protein